MAARACWPMATMRSRAQARRPALSVAAAGCEAIRPPPRQGGKRRTRRHARPRNDVTVVPESGTGARAKRCTTQDHPCCLSRNRRVPGLGWLGWLGLRRWGREKRPEDSIPGRVAHRRRKRRPGGYGGESAAGPSPPEAGKGIASPFIDFRMFAMFVIPGIVPSLHRRTTVAEPRRDRQKTEHQNLRPSETSSPKGIRQYVKAVHTMDR